MQNNRAYRGGREQGGFTLIEMLAALAIFSLAAMALMRLQNVTLSSTGRLQEQAYAQIVARNLAANLMTDPRPPTLGEASGESINAGRSFRWRQISSVADNDRLIRVEVNVTGERGARAQLIVVRPTQ